MTKKEEIIEKIHQHIGWLTDDNEGGWSNARKEFNDVISQSLDDYAREVIKEKEVTVTDVGEDEAWCVRYACSNCNCKMITYSSIYCPNCGGKIKR